MQAEQADPKGLIRESYAIEGISDAECRSIFIDWAIGLPVGIDNTMALQALLDRYGSQSDHPMTQVLTEALKTPPPTGRRGGRAGRLGA
ncbi:hypothetical protein GCM10010991_01930 [Gemmobacter aquaticus]|uniref:Uncharacterized protein n=1 Tax=Gemmobacter aquaticus TaxID=490185 RepID=A0A917YGT5_9RHOB|nr:hypothetical protein [Gemmobacter aquaticus]GGO24020.1 hypothetical protein GCM10010991_01930 [Gemmobacter aquaticus]